MVPKVAAKGTSFKGAGLYYLHDKKAKTAERVAFTHTENLPTDNPDRALDCMAYTALHQDEIKTANGAARTGRKLDKPVYTFSLSWAPDQAPTQEQMIEAGRETLKALRLEDHEALMVAHNDEPHPHLHLIVNRVNPATGKAAALSNDHLTLSRWAEGYERKFGKILCEQRVINNELRRKGQFVKDRRSLDAGSFHRWRRDRGRSAYAARRTEANSLAATHSGERQALYDAKQRRIRAMRAQIWERNRGAWAPLFRQQREEWRALNAMQKTAYLRLRHYLRHRGYEARPAGAKSGIRQTVADAMRAMFGRDNPHGALSRKHRSERAALAAQIRAQGHEHIADINRQYRRELDQLKQRQAQESRALAQEHSRQSQDQARALREGRDRQAFRKETGQALSDDFNERVRRRIERAKKRAAKERERGQDKGRERER